MNSQAQLKLASALQAVELALGTGGAPLRVRGWMAQPAKHERAGITTNKGRRRNKARARMARESRRVNRAA